LFEGLGPSGALFDELGLFGKSAARLLQFGIEG
jgi:hypothetical protein